MQFSTIAAAVLSLASLTALAAATPTPGEEPSCSTGPIECCNSVQKASSPAAQAVLGLLNIVLDDVNVLVGLDCTAVNVVGGVGQCSANSVCCTDNSHGNLISIGCAPITL